MNFTPLEAETSTSFARRGSRILAAATIAAMTIGAGLVMAPAASAAEGNGTVSGDVLFAGEAANEAFVSFFNVADPDVTVDSAYVADGTYSIDLPVGDYTARISTFSDYDHYVYETYGLDHGDYSTPPVISVTETAEATADFDYDYTVVSNESGTISPESAELGDTVTVTAATWLTTGVTNSYQWFAGDEPIAGATSNTLKLTDDLADTYISVVQTGSKAGGYYSTDTSNALGQVFGRQFEVPGYADINNTEPHVGDTLTMNVTDAWVPAATSYGYEWRVQRTEESSQLAEDENLLSTDKSFVIPAELQGKVIYGSIIAKRSGYTSDYRWAGETQPIAGPKLTALKPTLSGSAKVGGTLKVSTPKYNQTGVVSSYQWFATINGYVETIKKATSSSYKVPTNYGGWKVFAKVTGKKTGYSPVTVSSATKAIPYLKVTAATPKLSGTFKVGKTIKAKAGSWKPSGMQFYYVWNFNGKPYAQSEKGSFKLPKAAKGKKVTVTVSGYKAGYEYKTKTSKASTKVK